MLDDDAIRIRHMLDAAGEAIGFASGRTSEELAMTGCFCSRS
jgi:hypothetical protein